MSMNLFKFDLEMLEKKGYKPHTKKEFIDLFLHFLDVNVGSLMDKRAQYEFCYYFKDLYMKALEKSEEYIPEIINKRKNINYILKEKHIPYIIDLELNRWILIEADDPDNDPDYYEVWNDDDYYDRFTIDFSIKKEEAILVNDEDIFSCGYKCMFEANDQDCLEEFTNHYSDYFFFYFYQYFSEYFKIAFSEEEEFIKNFSSDFAESFASDLEEYFKKYHKERARIYDYIL